jgi:glycosyltransferase involved in cell wall biosynthesis
LGSNPAQSGLISVVITVKNEGPHLGRLLESLLHQEAPFEVVVIDALSHDRTFEVARQFEAKNPGMIRAIQRYGSRGIGRNTGAAMARGEFLAFTDGDCVADSQWLAGLRRGFEVSDVVAGRTIAIGRPEYAVLDRIELVHQGSDVTYPSCNLGYRRATFLSLGGFDPRFITAEDIDLNLRAVALGVRIRETPGAVIFHTMRATFIGFLIQAFWNGYGRKQLTEKHGSLWGKYRIRRLLANQRTVISWARLVAAMAGYLTRVFTGSDRRLSARPPGADAGPATQPAS